jgi:hypothetical protein
MWINAFPDVVQGILEEKVSSHKIDGQMLQTHLLSGRDVFLHFEKSKSNVKTGGPFLPHLDFRTVRSGEKQLREKLGRNHLCPCGSGRNFQEMLRQVGAFRPLALEEVKPSWLPVAFSMRDATTSLVRLRQTYWAGFPALDGEGPRSLSRRRRFLARFLACARLRVFSRALSFGIAGSMLF